MTEDASQASLSTSGSLSITDADDSSASFSSSVSAEGEVLGTLTITETGNWSYTVSNSAVEYLSEGQSATDAFIVSSSDGSASEIVTVTINGASYPASSAAPALAR